MVSAILLFEEKINTRAIECLREIEHVAGRPVLTGKYNKLLALCRACTKIGEASKVPDTGSESEMACIQSCVLWACQALRFGLRYEMISPGSVNGDSLDQTRKGSDSPVRLTHVLVARRFLLNHVAAIVEDARGLEDAAPQS